MTDPLLLSTVSDACVAALREGGDLVVNLCGVVERLVAERTQWRPISEFPGETWFWISDSGTRHFAPVLVYGPKWAGDWKNHYPEEGRDEWKGKPEVEIADTYEGKGFFTVTSVAPSDYDEYVKPTHWMPLPEPPKEGE